MIRFVHQELCLTLEEIAYTLLLDIENKVPIPHRIEGCIKMFLVMQDNRLKEYYDGNTRTIKLDDLLIYTKMTIDYTEEAVLEAKKVKKPRKPVISWTIVYYLILYSEFTMINLISHFLTYLIRL